MKNLTANPFIRLALAGIAVWIASIFMAHGQNKPDELKQRILAQAQSCSADDYAFTRTIRTEGRQNGKTEQHVTVEKFDPTQAAEARWTLVSMDGAPPSAEALNEFRKGAGKRRVPGYHRLASYFGSPATASSDKRGRTMFRFGPLPEESVTVMNSDVSSNATAEALIGEANGVPFAEQLRISVRPTRLKLVMKLEKFESTARYRIGPEGKPLLVAQTTDMTGSGMGQEGGAHTVTTYSDYRLVSRPR
jgi:hypothetical protein